MLTGRESLLFVVLGASLAASWLLVAALRPRIRPYAYVFATTPGSQLFWIGIARQWNTLLLVAPMLLVPAIAIFYAYHTRPNRPRAEPMI